MITDDLIVKLIEINARHDYGVDDLKKDNPQIANELLFSFCRYFANRLSVGR